MALAIRALPSGHGVPTTTPADGAIDQMYLRAKAGKWDKVLGALDADVGLAKKAAAYARPGSGWTFVHQAAFWGREDACRALLKRGAAPSATTNDALSPHAVARQRGHADLAAWLLAFADTTGATRPCSRAFDEASERRALTAFHVPYAGGLVRVCAGSRYFVDTCDCVLIGWHGSYDPPFGMDGIDLV
ncbi:Ankyrin repeat domain containing protein [Pandoravirus dulcis]|uniref:Ankyrin repeat domain containing protein n=1 Tax=Pandoravirus dulcis TaxID=1349409 RepID=S4VQ80_9VIRU|nr:Ankyrin repeat domain containing protein [Pandoravirus dulcis]AGO82442.1 Ankyrin repeat domain containing protein [Pandoravirus dulcis]